MHDFDILDRYAKPARDDLCKRRFMPLATTDHNKFNRPAMVEMARFDQVEMLFTDGQPPDPYPALLSQAGVTLVNCNLEQE